MNPRILTSPIDPNLVMALRAVAKSDLSSAAVISKQADFPVHEALPTLVDQGYVQEQAGRQRNGNATKLYSLTAKGQSALGPTGDETSVRPLPTVAAPRSGGLGTSIYEGSELRPYVGRAGSMDAFKHPSRVGEHLHHPNGSVTPVA